MAQSKLIKAGFQPILHFALQMLYHEHNEGQLSGDVVSESINTTHDVCQCNSLYCQSIDVSYCSIKYRPYTVATFILLMFLSSKCDNFFTQISEYRYFINI